MPEQEHSLRKFRSKSMGTIHYARRTTDDGQKILALCGQVVEEDNEGDQRFVTHCQSCKRIAGQIKQNEH